MIHEFVRLLFIAWDGVNLFKQVETVLDDVRFFFDRFDDIAHPLEQPNNVEVSQLGIVVFPRRVLNP